MVHTLLRLFYAPYWNYAQSHRYDVLFRLRPFGNVAGRYPLTLAAALVARLLLLLVSFGSFLAISGNMLGASALKAFPLIGAIPGEVARLSTRIACTIALALSFTLRRPC